MSMLTKEAQVQTINTHEGEMPVVVVDDEPNKEEDCVLVIGDESGPVEESGEDIVIQDSSETPVATIGIEVNLGLVPGSDLEVIDESEESDEDDANSIQIDEKDAKSKKKKKSEKWDWEKNGFENFFDWVKERLVSVPRHSGKDVAGIERAIAYMEAVETEISRAMRADIDGELDSELIKKFREEIDGGIDRLQQVLDTLKKKKKKKKASEEVEMIVKEAQMAPGVKGIVVTVPLLISRIARVCINGSISGGHDIEKIFHDQVKKYALDKREQAEVMQLLADMNYPVRQDRGFLIDEDVDPTSSDNYDWAANYQG